MLTVRFMFHGSSLGQLGRLQKLPTAAKLNCSEGSAARKALCFMGCLVNFWIQARQQPGPKRAGYDIKQYRCQAYLFQAAMPRIRYSATDAWNPVCIFRIEMTQRQVRAQEKGRN
jgi:hypothetical protein